MFFSVCNIQPAIKKMDIISDKNFRSYQLIRVNILIMSLLTFF